MPFHTDRAWEIIWSNIRGADLVLEILDARNPQGTRSHEIEDYMKDLENKGLILVLNKIDLVPRDVGKAWQKLLQKESPTMQFNALHPFNLQEFLHFMRENLKRHPLWSSKESKYTILVVGYPNSGKSTFIQALTRKRKKLGTSPLAGFTKVIQKIKLDEKIYLIDTPGVIPVEKYDEEVYQALDTGSIRPQLIQDKESVIDEIVRRVGVEGLNAIYKTYASDQAEFIEQLGKARGILAKGGVVREDDVFSVLIRDWQTNHIAFYYAPDPANPSSKGIPYAGMPKRAPVEPTEPSGEE
ncbi:MAG TPA: GTPase [Candidatus Lokiarchaeia archaeon]|nr:GTPase [Candidatus Lokiarchaeia archaeon]